MSKATQYKSAITASIANNACYPDQIRDNVIAWLRGLIGQASLALVDQYRADSKRTQDE